MKNTIINLILILVLILSICAGIAIGPADITITDIVNVVHSKIDITYDISHISKSSQNIIWFIRAPRVILSALVGICLALSGVMMQAFTKNPLADPYILGISSGASFGAVMAIITPALSFLGSYKISIGAFIGALACILLVTFISYSGNDNSPISIVLIGIAVSSLFGALTNYAVYSAPSDAEVRQATFWMLGGFGGAKWGYIPLMLISVILIFGCLLLLASSINALLMGEKTAITIGVNVKRLRGILIFFSALLTSISVAVSGCIGFIGLVIPHAIRSLVGANHTKVIPLTTLSSAIIMIWLDVLSRMIIIPQELPIGIITAFIGAPVFLFLVKSRNYRFGE